MPANSELAQQGADFDRFRYDHYSLFNLLRFLDFFYKFFIILHDLFGQSQIVYGAVRFLVKLDYGHALGRAFFQGHVQPYYGVEKSVFK